MRLLIAALLLSFYAGTAAPQDSEFREWLAGLEPHEPNSWNYSKRQDEMTDEIKATRATLENEAPPYGTIHVYNKKNRGVSVFLSFGGELDCPESCSILLRVDESPPRSLAMRYTYYGPSSGLSLVPEDELAFIEFIKNAKRIRMELRYTDSKYNRFKGKWIADFRAKKPLEIRPLRSGVGSPSR